MSELLSSPSRSRLYYYTWYNGLRRRPVRPPVAASRDAENVSSIVAKDGVRRNAKI